MAYSWESAPYKWASADALEDHAYTLPAIRHLLPDGVHTVLDVGCGNGYIASRLAEMGYSVVGVDASEEGVAIARNAHPNVRFEVCSAYDDLSHFVENVDLVVSSEVIEHLYRPKLFLDNVYKVLRSGGHVILTTPYHGYLKNLALSLFDYWDKHHTVDWEGGHIKFFSERTLKKMLMDCGFQNVQYHNAGRIRWLWKSMVCRAVKPAKSNQAIS